MKIKNIKAKQMTYVFKKVPTTESLMFLTFKTNIDWNPEGNHITI